MKKSLLLSVIIILILSIIYIIFPVKRSMTPLSPLFSDAALSEGTEEDPHARVNYELMRLADPATGEIPKRMRARELAFVKTLPSEKDFVSLYGSKGLSWDWRGPYNVGGRTRGLAIDVTNENILIAGSVSGGVWRSSNGGINWIKTTSPEQNFGATSIVQDRRNGKTNTWYFSTGEPYGTSASGGSAFYLGNGVYKSINGGQSWTLLQSTANPTPQTFSDYMNLIWNMALDASDTLNDVVYLATYGRIYRSSDGGSSWSIQLGNSGGSSYFTDVAVTSTGVVYATLSSDGNDKGVWRSANGTSWTNITPPNYPMVYDRMVIGISPANENDVFLLGVSPGYGQYNELWNDGEEWTSLWKYTYISGNGSGSGGKWEDRSSSIPSDGNKFDHFNAQGSYNLVVRVKPNDTNVVFIGGTNLYRSDDAFRSDSNTTQIGGYERGTTLPNYEQYANQHPDQHGLVFLPSNPDIAFSNTDGGVAKTLDNLADTVEWISLNNGYLTTQFYTVAIDHGTTGNNIIVGGMQDNGTYYTNTTNPVANWTMPSKGDGSFCAIEDGNGMFYFSRQNGKTIKATLDSQGNPTAFARIDPIGGKNYLFINPFIIDPNDNNIMYLAGGKTLWRNDDLSQIPLNNNYDSISTNWIQIIDTLTITDIRITALAVSKIPANRLYFGTSKKNIYRIDNAHASSHYIPVNINPVINPPNPPVLFPSNGYISCIAVDPKDADKVLVVFSNYNVLSLFYTADGGTNWSRVAGNLEETISSGVGSGPSCRWASILPVGNKTAYLVGTSAGLFATDTLIGGDSTIWIQQSVSSIGTTVVDMIDTRESDGLVVVATHGNGIFSTYITDISQIAGVKNYYSDKQQLSISAFPNPFRSLVNIRYNLPQRDHVNIQIFDIDGRLISTLLNQVQKAGIYDQQWDGRDRQGNRIAQGIYFCNIMTSRSVCNTRILYLR